MIGGNNFMTMGDSPIAIPPNFIDYDKLAVGDYVYARLTNTLNLSQNTWTIIPFGDGTTSVDVDTSNYVSTESPFGYFTPPTPISPTTYYYYLNVECLFFDGTSPPATHHVRVYETSTPSALVERSYTPNITRDIFGLKCIFAFPTSLGSFRIDVKMDGGSSTRFINAGSTLSLVRLK